MQFINISDYVLLAWFVTVFSLNAKVIIQNIKNKTNLIGEPSIPPILFYLGKITMFATWIILLLIFIGLIHQRNKFLLITDITTSILIIISAILIILGVFNLKNNLRAGIPLNKTKLKTKGIYKYTRNPLHIGAFIFGIITLIYAPKIYILILIIIFVVTHHLMVLAEEKYLKKTFKEKYEKYKKQTPRYI